MACVAFKPRLQPQIVGSDFLIDDSRIPLNRARKFTLFHEGLIIESETSVGQKRVYVRIVPGVDRIKECARALLEKMPNIKLEFDIHAIQIKRPNVLSAKIDFQFLDEEECDLFCDHIAPLFFEPESITSGAYSDSSLFFTEIALSSENANALSLQINSAIAAMKQWFAHREIEAALHEIVRGEVVEETEVPYEIYSAGEDQQIEFAINGEARQRAACSKLWEFFTGFREMIREDLRRQLDPVIKVLAEAKSQETPLSEQQQGEISQCCEKIAGIVSSHLNDREEDECGAFEKAFNEMAAPYEEFFEFFASE